MILLQKEKRSTALPPGDALILLEALFGFAVAGIMIEFAPFHVYTRWLKFKGCYHVAPREVLHHIRWAVVYGARPTLFDTKRMAQIEAHASLTLGAMIGRQLGDFGEIARFGLRT